MKYMLKIFKIIFYKVIMHSTYRINGIQNLRLNEDELQDYVK